MAQKTHTVKTGPHPRPHVSPSPLLQRQPPVTSFSCYLLALFQIHREHVYTQNVLSMNTLLHWSYCSPYFSPYTGSCLRTDHAVPPTAHLQAAPLGLIHHLGALLQNAAVQIPEVGHVGLHDVQHFRLILSNHHPKVTWLKQIQNQFRTATPDSALWTAGPKRPVNQSPAVTLPQFNLAGSRAPNTGFFTFRTWTGHPRQAGTCLGENRASQITEPVSQLKYTEVQKEVTLRVNMHLFFRRRSFSIINFHLVNKTPPVTNQRRELCVSRPWCCSLSLALPAAFV